MYDEQEEPPEWLAHLEKPKVFKLGHEYGSGAACLSCAFCPGLQLHFWRKKCLRCNCPLDAHKVEDDFSQYQLLFGDNKHKKIKLNFLGDDLTFDWIPEQSDPKTVEEYLRSLPVDRRPITGTRGGEYRRRQLGRQLPRYDIDPTNELNEEEEMAFQNYIAALRDHAAGLGSVIKWDPDIHRAVPAWVLEESTIEPVENHPQYADGLAIPSSPRCHQCHKQIKENVVVEAERLQGALWHAPCFICTDCGELLVDLHYYCHEGKLYCGRDYANAVQKLRCLACDELIFEKEYASANGKFYHTRHFCCANCDEPLGGQQFLYKDNDIICPSCYEKQYAKICTACLKAISVFSERVQIGTNSFHKNSSCFICSSCRSPLEETKVFLDKSLLLCSNCL